MKEHPETKPKVCASCDAIVTDWVWQSADVYLCKLCALRGCHAATEPRGKENRVGERHEIR